MIRTYVKKDLQYVIEAHIRIYREAYNYDDRYAEFITNAVNAFGLSGNDTALALEQEQEA
ncbi:hypothetical protein [Paenibacillus xylanilyticus]|uniref:hypothetical protein n=1 Tax=Paenibacillus xylanilyticus TaxID=248903 RepID=UPI0039A21114